MTAPLRLRAWQVINGEVNRRIAERDRELRALLDRAQADLAAGWPEAAQDALGRARKLLCNPTASNRR